MNILGVDMKSGLFAIAGKQKFGRFGEAGVSDSLKLTFFRFNPLGYFVGGEIVVLRKNQYKHLENWLRKSSLNKVLKVFSHFIDKHLIFRVFILLYQRMIHIDYLSDFINQHI